MARTQHGTESAEAPSSDRSAATALFQVYKRLLSPAFHGMAPGGCKYLPTCSEYAYAAVVHHGWLRGGWLALRRLARCHPLAQGGADPVPLAHPLEPKR